MPRITPQPPFTAATSAIIDTSKAEALSIKEKGLKDDTQEADCGRGSDRHRRKRACRRSADPDVRRPRHERMLVRGGIGLRSLGASGWLRHGEPYLPPNRQSRPLHAGRTGF